MYTHAAEVLYKCCDHSKQISHSLFSLFFVDTDSEMCHKRHRMSLLFFLTVTAVMTRVKASSPEQCDLFTGTWVVDESYPLYKAATCPFIEREFRCEPNGRPDLIYTHYRWKPLSCNLLRLSSLLSFHWLLFFLLSFSLYHLVVNNITQFIFIFLLLFCIFSSGTTHQLLLLLVINIQHFLWSIG